VSPHLHQDHAALPHHDGGHLEHGQPRQRFAYLALHITSGVTSPNIKYDIWRRDPYALLKKLQEAFSVIIVTKDIPAFNSS
jgi:hypothetical protein